MIVVGRKPWHLQYRCVFVSFLIGVLVNQSLALNRSSSVDQQLWDQRWLNRSSLETHSTLSQRSSCSVKMCIGTFLMYPLLHLSFTYYNNLPTCFNIISGRESPRYAAWAFLSNHRPVLSILCRHSPAYLNHRSLTFHGRECYRGKVIISVRLPSNWH